MKDRTKTICVHIPVSVATYLDGYLKKLGEENRKKVTLSDLIRELISEHIRATNPTEAEKLYSSTFLL